MMHAVPACFPFNILEQFPAKVNGETGDDPGKDMGRQARETQNRPLSPLHHDLLLFRQYGMMMPQIHLRLALVQAGFDIIIYDWGIK